MKLKKIISAIGALSIFATMFASLTITEASLGGKPTVEAKFVEYTTNSKVTWAKAWVDVTVDFSSAEALEAYLEESVYDEDEEDYILVKKGNGLTTFGMDITNTNANFVPQETGLEKPNSPFTLTVKGSGYNSVVPSIATPADYYVGSTTITYKVNFKVTSDYFDETTKIGFADVSLDGHNVTEGNTWSYGQNQNTITVNSIDIPSYNTWVAGSATPTPTATATPTPTPVVTPEPTPTVEPTPEVTPEPTEGKGTITTEDAADAAAWAWEEFTGVAGNAVKVSINANGSAYYKTFKLGALVENTGETRVGVIIQYNPQNFNDVSVTGVELVTAE